MTDRVGVVAGVPPSTSSNVQFVRIICHCHKIRTTYDCAMFVSFALEFSALYPVSKSLQGAQLLKLNIIAGDISLKVQQFSNVNGKKDKR